MSKNKSATVTPNQLAERLAGAANREKIGKTFVRPFLRKHYARDAQVKGSGWLLSDEQVAAVTSAYHARRDGKTFDFTAWQKARRARKPKVVTPTPDVTPDVES